MLKRICYVIPTLSVGGTEKQLVNLIRGLVKDHEITVICTKYAGALAGDVRRAGGFIRELRTHSGWSPTLKYKLTHAFRNHRPDIVHSFMFGFDLAVNRAARAVGVPIVISSRRQISTWKKRRHILVQKKANKYVDCVVSNSEAVSEFAIKQEHADPSMFRVIHNGIDADKLVRDADRNHLRYRFKIPPFHSNVIGIVANFSPVKDHELFVRIAENLAGRRPDVHFVLVGRGPLVDRIEKLVVQYGIEDRFTHTTSLEEIPELYALMDVSVLCSKSEGFPNAAMEAMAAGTPVVAPDVGGIPELIKHGETGRLVSSRKPSDFADEINWLLENPEESAAMTQRAGECIRENFSIQKMAKSYRDLYTELLVKTLQEGS